MGERDPHHPGCIAAVDPAVLVIGGQDFPVVIPGTGPAPGAPLAHSEPMAIPSSLEQETAQMERGWLADLEAGAVLLELGGQREVAGRRGGERVEGEGCTFSPQEYTTP